MRARMSMRWTVTLFTAFFLTVSLGLVLVATMNKTRRQWSADSLIHARSVARLLAGTSRDPLRQGDVMTLDQIVREVAGNDTLERVIIADREGKIIADSAPGEGRPALLKAVPDLHGMAQVLANGRRVQVVMPVMRGEIPLGAVFVRCALQEHDALLIAMHQWGMLIVATTILLACTTAYVLAALISQPLQRLARRMSAVAEGRDPKPLAEEGCYELRQMAKSFNGMARALRRRMGDLESLHLLASAASRSLDLCGVVQAAVRCIEDAVPGSRAQIWLRDPVGAHLVDGACRGPLGEAVMVPLSDESPLALAVARGEPVLAGDPGRGDAVDRWAAERYGAASLIAVPLNTQEAEGVLLVFRQDPALPLTQEDVQFLQLAADEIALSVANARMFARESHMAEMFQRVLLPETPPEIEQLEIAVRWETASGDGHVGGDYFDFIALPGGRWGIVIGDVCGKGALAASYTAMAKYALRSFAYETGSPADILRRTNAALYPQLNSTDVHEGAPMFITMLCAIYDPASGRLAYSHAGHPLGTLAHADSGIVITLDQGGPPVGVVPDAGYYEEVLHLAPGDSLALYTDGIVEAARSEHVVESSRIAELLRANQENSVHAAADAVMAEASRLAAGNAADDTTLLVLRVRDAVAPLVLPAMPAEVAAG